MTDHYIGECPVTCGHCRMWIRLTGQITRVLCSVAAKYVDLGGGRRVRAATIGVTIDAPEVYEHVRAMMKRNRDN